MWCSRPSLPKAALCHRGLSALCIVMVILGVTTGAAGSPIEGWRKKLNSGGSTVTLNPLNPATVVADDGSGSLLISYDRGATWPVSRATGQAAIRQILIHPNDTTVVFCTGAEGLRKSTDYGLTWRTMIPGYSASGELVCIDYFHPDTMFAAGDADGTIFKSFDRGEHWFTQGLALTNSVTAFSVRPDNPNIMYTGIGLGAIAKSTDGGLNWRITKHVSSGDVRKFSISPTSPLIAYASIDGTVDTAVGVWKTTNGGENWFRTNLPDYPFRGIDIDPADPNVVYAGTYSSQNGAVYKTTDGGNSWVPMTTGFSARGAIESIKFHPLDPLTKWAAVTGDVFGTGGAYRYGISNTTVSGFLVNAIKGDTIRNGFATVPAAGDSIDLVVSAGRYSFSYFDGDPSLTPTVRARAYPYYDKTQQIAFQVDSLVEQPIAMDELPRRSITGIVRDSATHLPQRSLVTIRNTTSVGASNYSDSSDASGQFRVDSLYISYPPINRYDDIQIAPDVPYGHMRIRPITLDTAGLSYTVELVPAQVLVIAASDSGKYLSYYSSALDSLGITYNSWDELRRGFAPVRFGSVLRKKTLVFYTGSLHSPLAQGDKDSLAAFLDLGCNLFITGQDIAEMNDTSSLMKNYLRTGFQSNAVITYVSGLSGDIFNAFGFSTVNFGAGNQTSRDVLKPLDSRVKPVMGYGFGTSGTAAVRIDTVTGGGKAIVMGFGFEAISGGDIRQLVMHQAIGYLDGSIVVAVDDRPENVLRPAKFGLAQNYPNPFNPTTEIGFQIPELSDVVLKIFDLLGREVSTIIDEKREPGDYSVTWDAARFAGGTYYCRILATPVNGSGPRFVDVRKMLLVK